MIQGLQLKEGDCSVFEGEEKNQTDEEGARSDASLITKWRQSKDFPIKDLEWSKHQSAPREFKEVLSRIFSFLFWLSLFSTDVFVLKFHQPIFELEFTTAAVVKCEIYNWNLIIGTASHIARTQM